MMTDDKVYNGSIDPGNPLYINFSNLLDSWDMGFYCWIRTSIISTHRARPTI